MTAENLPTSEMKLCTVHGVEHPIEEFPFKNREAGIRHARCKEAQREMSRRHHAANKDWVNPAIKARKQKVAAENRAKVQALLVERGCVRCGNTNLRSLSVQLPEGSAPFSEKVSAGNSWDYLRRMIDDNEIVCRRHQRRWDDTKSQTDPSE